MLINDVIKKVYPVYESKDADVATQALGKELDRIYNHGGTWTINGISPTMSEVGELYDVYKNIVHDHVKLSDITTISKTVRDILDSLGFNLKEQGTGWALTEGKTVSDLPEWAKKIWDEQIDGRLLNFYDNGDCIDLFVDRYGNAVNYRIYKDGKVFER